MANNFLIKAFFITAITCFSGYCGIKEAHAYLVQNRKVIINSFSRCHPYGSPLFKLRCNPPLLDYMKALLENNSVNDSIMELTVREFLSNLQQFSNLMDDRDVSIISNNVSITFLTKLINGSNEMECGLVNEAAQELERWVSYPSLRKYKNQINTAVMNSCLEEHFKRKIRILTGPDELERQALLKERYPYEELALQARLGDSAAIERFRVRYQKSEDFDNREIDIRQIFNTGRIDLIKMVIADFNDPMYDVFYYRTVPPCTSRSTQYAILRGLSRMYPEEKLLNEDLNKMSGHNNRNISPKQIREYLEAVTEWLEKTYAVKIKGKPKAYTFKGGCVHADI